MTSTRQRRVPVCILGAGPHGLAMALHLRAASPDLADESMVIDPTGRWMSTWDEQFARLDIDVLRSPSVHHPGPEVDALSAFVEQHGFMTSGLPYDPPMTAAFRAFSHHLVENAGLGPPLAERPRDITPEPGGGLRIETSSASVIAERLIIATNPHRRNVPAWLWPLLGQSTAELAHAADIDLGSLPDLTGERIAIVGGGLTAAHLALGAARRGAAVDLIARRPLRTRSFDTDPGWLGPKHLRAFEECADPRRRLDLALEARDGGTIPQWMRDRLDDDRITIRDDSDVVEAAAAAEGYRLSLRSGDDLTARRVWLATGTTPDLGALRCLQPLLPDIATIDGLPVVDDNLRVGLHPVHVMGRLAMLALGPASGNLWGARTAARRITQAITGVTIDLMSNLPEGGRRSSR